MILPALQYHPYRTLANLRRKFVRRLAHQPVLSGVQVSGNPGAHQIDIVDAIQDGKYSKTLMDRLLDLEAREETLKATIAAEPIVPPDIHPNIAAVYAKKVERLAEALGRAEDRDEAADAIRSLIEQITLTPGDKRGEMLITLHGEFGAILKWLGGPAMAGTTSGITGGADGGNPRVSVEMVAGARLSHARHSLRVAI